MTRATRAMSLGTSRLTKEMGSTGSSRVLAVLTDGLDGVGDLGLGFLEARGVGVAVDWALQVERRRASGASRRAGREGRPWRRAVRRCREATTGMSTVNAGFWALGVLPGVFGLRAAAPGDKPSGGWAWSGRW